MRGRGRAAGARSTPTLRSVSVNLGQEVEAWDHAARPGAARTGTGTGSSGPSWADGGAMDRAPTSPAAAAEAWGPTRYTSPLSVAGAAAVLRATASFKGLLRRESVRTLQSKPSCMGSRQPPALPSPSLQRGERGDTSGFARAGGVTPPPPLRSAAGELGSSNCGAHDAVVTVTAGMLL
eukprot:gene27723-7130_t